MRRSRIGKSLRIRSTSNCAGGGVPSVRSMTLAIRLTFSRTLSLRPGPALGGGVRRALLHGDAEFLPHALVALVLQLAGQLRAAGLHDPPAHHDVDPV